ncbi:response regulator [Acuticoccus sp. MNP-M23]|uniref:response regulator n=1 Tax=Acuticoccus sp. MNP-M23 TaxID=3072793 RepID=UPI002815C989|nr:response regulator [Acuticoccus sp. MNP-M23]WMS43463.1 response regulator [Acuticoccus sp. MNP-M23]
MTAPQRIVVCDDEAPMRRMLRDHFGASGYDVREAADAAALMAALAAEHVDLVILDVRMPGTDGLAALRELRMTSRVPVIMLTAADDVVDKVLGLEFGADDYVVKPVDLRELLARVRAALRRAEVPVSPKAPGPGADSPVTETAIPDGAVAFGPHRLDLAGARLFRADGEEIPLTAMEFSLLRTFAQNRGRVLNRDQLLAQAHGGDWDPFDRSIDLRVSRIRRKIEAVPEKPVIIRTVRGIGYVFD